MNSGPFADEWNRLKATGNSEGFKTRIYPDHHLDFWIKFTGNMHRCLQILVPEDLQEPELPNLEGFECRVDLQGSQRLLTFELSDSRLNKVFDALLTNLIHTSGRAPTEKSALGILVERLRLWTELLKKRGQKKSLGEVIGLLSELIVLEKFMDHGSPFELILPGWRGPDGDSSDIGIDNRRVEIKAKMVTQHLSIDISSADQLTDDGKDLFLAVNFFTKSPTGTSVRDVVARLEDKLSEYPRLIDVFFGKLMLAGFDETAEEFDEPFELSNTRAFIASDDNFPKIQVRDLNPGIEKVRYKIDFSALEPYECDVNDLMPKL